MEKNHMRRLIAVFGNPASKLGITGSPAQLRGITCLTALVGGMALTQAFAREPVEPEARPTNKITPAAAVAPRAEVAIPACLERLKLTQPQEGQAREIVRRYDATLDAVWK